MSENYWNSLIESFFNFLVTFFYTISCGIRCIVISITGKRNVTYYKKKCNKQNIEEYRPYYRLIEKFGRKEAWHAELVLGNTKEYFFSGAVS